MKTNHTPGPWEPLEQGVSIQSSEGYHEVSATAPNGTLVNICSMFEGEFSNAALDPADETSYTITPDEALSNARLVAAAPDLLAALESVLFPIESNDFATAAQIRTLYTSEIQAARAAISKAKGKK